MRLSRKIVLAAAMSVVFIGPLHATETEEKPPIDPAHIEMAKCLNYIGNFKKKFPPAGDAAIGMLGRIPPCEVQKVIEAWYAQKFWRRQ